MRNSLYTLLLLALILPQGASAARLWSSGCEFQSDLPGNGLNTLLEFTDGVATSTNGNATVYTAIKHSGNSSCRFNAAAADGTIQARTMYLQTQTATDQYFRFYFYIVSAPDEDAAIFQVWDRGIDGWEGGLVLETDRQLHWANDEGATDGQGTTVLATGQWYRIEINYDAVDQVLVYVDGAQEFDSGAHTGDSVDTMNLDLCDNTPITCGADGIAQGEWLFDDVAMNDTAGTAQTGLPGAGNIVYMQPDSAGDGNGCSAGDSTSIDELTPDDATTICVLDADVGGDIIDVNAESSSNAGIDSYDTITLILVGLRASGASAATYAYNARIKSAAGGTTSSGSALSRAVTTYQTNGGTANVVGAYTLASYTDPTTAVAWTPTGTNSLDNMQIGANASDGNPNVHVSTIWALVEYLDGAAPSTALTPHDVINGTMIINTGTVILK